MLQASPMDQIRLAPHRWRELSMPEPAVGSASPALQSLLQQRLPSIEQIQIVLLLRGDQSRSWPATEVASELKMAQESTSMRLFLLASSGLLLFEPSGVPRYRYTAADGEVEALLGELAELYDSDRAAVAALVDAPADPLRSFSDAFKFKK